MLDRPNDLDNRLIQTEHYGADGAPLEAWAWLREHDPIHWTTPTGIRPFWSITTHAELMEVSAQPEIFSNSAGGVVVTSSATRRSLRSVAATTARRVLPADVRRRVRHLRPTPDAFRPIVMMDPPDHRVFRKIASGFFTPRGIHEVHDVVQRATATVFESMSAAGDTVDFVEAASHRQPMLILSELLGLDAGQTIEVLELTTAHYETSSDEHTVSAVEERSRWIELIDEVVADRRAKPRDDLASLLVHATIDERPLQPAELRGYFLILFTAGHDTTRHSLSGGLNAFLDFPEQFERLRGDSALISTAVEEIVRWTTPVNYMKRTALQDYELSGTAISRGDELALFYGSASRDAKVFAEPDRFDIGRSPNRHLGFGWAEHYCLGAHLARSSLQTFLGELGRRVASMERAGDPTFTAANFVTGHRTLPVTFQWAEPS